MKHLDEQCVPSQHCLLTVRPLKCVGIRALHTAVFLPPFDPDAPSFSLRRPVTRFTIVYGPTTGNRQVPQASDRSIQSSGCSLARLGGICCRTRFSFPNFDLTARPVRNSKTLAEFGMVEGQGPSLHAAAGHWGFSASKDQEVLQGRVGSCLARLPVARVENKTCSIRRIRSSVRSGC